MKNTTAITGTKEEGLGNSYDERYKKLNTAQKKAVDTVEGPVLVVAGPGSGKTEILSLRVGNILKQTDIAPSNILCLTFTDSAAINMRKRLVGLIGRDGYKVAIHTFHSFGTEIINRNPEFFYNGANFVSADSLTQLSIIEDILKELDYGNPLRSEHPEQGFVYSGAILNAISYLKKAGLTPDEFRDILKHNQEEQDYANPLLAEVFDQRMSKTIFPKVAQLLAEFSKYKSKPFPLSHLKPWLPAVASTLKRALENAEEEEKATPLSKWKTSYTRKDEDGKRVHKDSMNTEKLQVLAGIYEKYRKEMYERSFYDFDDMLLETIMAMKKNNTLRYEIQEQFQYILVDEFQDTNDAQIRLLRLISNAPVNEGNPNVMAVGDDDQAIYKFQGAEISNILNFNEEYDNPDIITMTENYRSTQEILNVARNIIQKGEERLENIMPELEKKLVASNPNIAKGNIIRKVFTTDAHEMCFIADEVQRLVKEGKNPEDIAIISRTHKKLMEVAVYLNALDIPIRYERQQDIFKEPHIHQLITMAKFISTLARKNQSEADDLLPEILSYPFWGLDRETIWKLSVTAEHGGKRRLEWLGVMRESESKSLRRIADFFDELTAMSQVETLESVLDKMVGSHLSLVVESEDDDEDNEVDKNSESSKVDSEFVSPFREYYFGIKEFQKNTAVYLAFLSSLRVFVHALREYKNGEQLTLDDLVEFTELHIKNKLQLTDSSPFTSAGNSVSLMTSHKAKGLEFDTVFVLSCQDDIWAQSSRGGARLSFHENLKIAPAGDTSDDQLKLFYVAITRAKSNLYLTSYTTKQNGKESPELRFLNTDNEDENENKAGGEVETGSILKVEKCENDDGEIIENTGILERSWDSYYYPPFVKDEKALLQNLLKDYQMPVTHFNNFLNVKDGGPQVFLEQNLLRFPQSMSASASYGSAMHKVAELMYTALRKDGVVPEIDTVLEWFERELSMQRLSPKDNALFLKRGKDALVVYHKERSGSFDTSHKIEMDFKHQGVMIGDAHITGKIDKIINLGSGKLEVVDIKTGKSAEKWNGTDVYEKVKLYKYKNQLIFYKLLVENSRDFASGDVVSVGHLEFMEPKNDKIVDLSLEIESGEVERIKDLIEIVYKKIMDLDFPDISKYSKDIKGIKAFEDDLLNEKR